MTRRRIGSKRTSRDSFVDDKTDLAVNSVYEISEMIRTKAMRPLGFGPLPPPNLARDADLDALIYEGIPWINRGRGIPDPTPGNWRNPLNRRLRREQRAVLGTPRRINTFAPNALATISRADGPFAGMVDSRVLRRPENIVSVDDSRFAVAEVHARVDAVLGPKPRTLVEALDNLVRLEGIVNGGSPNGRNFKLEFPYFKAQMQPELGRLSPRFVGDATPMSRYDYGVYYAIASQLLALPPDIFEDVHLWVLASNNPDVPNRSGAAGSTSAMPSYAEIRDYSVQDRHDVPHTSGNPSQSKYGIKDMSDALISHYGAKATSGARLPLLINLPIYKSEDQERGVFSYIDPMQQSFVNMVNQIQGRQGPPAQAIEQLLDKNPPSDQFEDDFSAALREWEEIAAKTGQIQIPLMDTVHHAVALGYLQEIEEVQSKISQLRQISPVNPNAPANIRNLETSVADLISEAQEAMSMVTVIHEFGHALDSIGQFRTHPDYGTITSQASGGINSQFEYDRDLLTLGDFRNGRANAATDDLATAIQRKFTKEQLMRIAVNEATLEAITQLTPILENQSNGAQALETQVNQMVAGGGPLSGSLKDSLQRWVAGLEEFEIQDPTRPLGRQVSRSLVRSIRNLGIFSPALESNPPLLMQKAEQVLEEVERLGEQAIFAKVLSMGGDVYDFYKKGIKKDIDHGRAIIKLLNSEGLRAFATGALAVGVYYGFLEYLLNSVQAITQVANKAQTEQGTYQYVMSWLNNQTIDVDEGRTNGFRNLMTDVLSGNPNAVREFMTLHGQSKSRPWFDAQNNLDNVEYLKWVFADLGNPKGMTSYEAMYNVNSWHHMRGTNGWKDLTDDEIMDVRSAVTKLTDYAGPADYAFNVPLPKFEIASNAETYAEMNPIIFMKIESMLKRLEGRERKALERLYEQMIAQARKVLGSTNQGGQTP